MTVQHIVSIRFNDDVERQRIDEDLAAPRALEETTPELIQLTLVQDVMARARGYTRGLIDTQEDRAVLDSCAAHPYHVSVAQDVAADDSLPAWNSDCKPKRHCGERPA